MPFNLLSVCTILFLSIDVFASAQSCVVQKSLLWVDSSGYHKRIAETKSFTIVSAEHEDPYILEFFETDGSKWEEVQVMTGTLLGSPMGDVFQVVAEILNVRGEVTSRLALVSDRENKFSRSITTIDLVDTDFDPNLTIDCKLIP